MVSHQGRIQCLLASIGIISKKKICKFKNCAIISLQFKKIDDKTISLFCEMVYEGELDSEEDKPSVYYGTGSHEYSPRGFIYGKYKKWEKRSVSDEEFIKKTYAIDEKTLRANFNLLPKDIPDNEIITIYLMRHGQGTHNINRSYIKSYNDALLTQEGCQQAKKAAIHFFKGENSKNPKNFDIIFVSDLKRTSQTAGVFVSTINKLSTIGESKIGESKIDELTIDDEFIDFLIRAKTITGNGVLVVKEPDMELYKKVCTINVIVLPCSHEITLSKGTFVKLRECDNEYRLLDSPNKMSCFTEDSCPDLEVNTDKDKQDKLHAIKVNIDWSFYDTFYDKKRRGSIRRGNGAYCENTNMISMALFYANNNTKDENSVDYNYENLNSIKHYIKGRKEDASLERGRFFSRKNMGEYIEPKKGGKKTRKYPNKKHKQTHKRKPKNIHKIRKTRRSNL